MLVVSFKFMPIFMGEKLDIYIIEGLHNYVYHSFA